MHWTPVRFYEMGVINVRASKKLKYVFWKDLILIFFSLKIAFLNLLVCMYNFFFNRCFFIDAFPNLFCTNFKCQNCNIFLFIYIYFIFQVRKRKLKNNPDASTIYDSTERGAVQKYSGAYSTYVLYVQASFKRKM